MNWLPKQLGAEPKKMAILGALVAGFGVVYWMNRTPSPDAPATVAAKVPGDPPALKTLTESSASFSREAPRRTSGRGGMAARPVEDFHPTIKLQEGMDVSRIDPTLKLDLLAKVREVPMEGGVRSLFEFSQPPAPPAPKVEPIKVPPPTVAPPPPPSPPPSTTQGTPPTPPKPSIPIPLKYYGFAGTPGGPRRGCFLDGDPATGEVYVAAENDVVKDRYKVISFGVNSVLMEDIVNKDQQTLPLTREAEDSR